MNYQVILDSYAIGNERLAALNLPPIPGTTLVMELDTESGLGKEIWWGYLQMRERQKKEPAQFPYRVTLAETAPEIDKFREAINIFFRFLAGEGRDNGQQVTKIEVGS